MKSKFQLNWGTSIALLVSFAALITTIYEANILKSQQEALVWPHFVISQYFSGEGFGYRARNSGTGPAIITSVEANYRGEVVASFMDVLDHVYPDSTINYYGFNYRGLNNTVYRPGEERFVFFASWSPAHRVLVEKMDKVEFKIEYRSVLDDYWIYDTRTNEHTRGRFKSETEFYTSR